MSVTTWNQGGTAASVTLGKNIGQLGPVTLDPALSRRPERFIHIYSVSKRSFEASCGAIPKVVLRGCKADERVALVAEIPDPFIEVTPLEQNGRLIPVETPGLMVAMDLLNPDNWTGNQDIDTSTWTTGLGKDLNRYGIFYSVNYPPLESEVTAAENRLARYQQKLVDQVLEMDRTNPAGLKELLTADHREALDALDVETSFHKKREVKVRCPNCAERMNAGAKFHKSETLGMICVMPNAESWRVAVAAGVKSAKDVPEEFRVKAARTRKPNEGHASQQTEPDSHQTDPDDDEPGDDDQD